MARPGLDGAERMFDQASSDPHGLGPLVHPNL